MKQNLYFFGWNEIMLNGHFYCSNECIGVNDILKADTSINSITSVTNFYIFLCLCNEGKWCIVYNTLNVFLIKK